MAESFSRWESDPLFSAAEVVQDSADRMESVFRTLMHEQSLVQGDFSDPKLLSSMQYHRRDLVTALETTRWQLEDFEREVSLAAISDKSNSRENAISKHRQFIRAIREQIIQVEKSVKASSSMEESSKSSPWMNFNEQDADGLASFLSGVDAREHSLDYDTGRSIMRRFLDSTEDNDEIVELKTEEVELRPMNSIKNSDHSSNSSKNPMSWKIGSHISNRYDINEPIFFQGRKEGSESYNAIGPSNLECGDLGAKCYSYKYKSRETFWRFLRNFCLANKSKGSFTKRRKDGEVTDDLIENTEQMNSFSTVNIPPDEQGLNSKGSRSAMQFYGWIQVFQRRLQRSQYLILYNRYPIRLASAILVTLIVLGMLAFRIF